MQKKGRDIFNEYVKQFDLRDEKILLKFHHTYRVVNYAMDIANTLNLSIADQNLVYLCALYHDVGRFEQYRQYKTYSDLKSVNHGLLGQNILKNKLIDKITNDKEEQEIILFAVANHNKRFIEAGTKKQIFITKIIRDADKMDIMKEQGFIVKENNPVLSNDLVKELLNNESCQDKYIHSSSDMILRQLGFIYDINFNYTYEFVVKEKIVENKINLLEINLQCDLTKLEEHLLTYIKGVIQC